MSSGRYVMSWRVLCLHVAARSSLRVDCQFVEPFHLVESVYIDESARRVGLHRRVGAIEHSG